MPSNHLILGLPLLLLQSFPASGSFQMSQLFTSGGQSIGASASASVLPMNIQDRFPLGWTGWISLQSKGLSRVFSSTTVQTSPTGTVINVFKVRQLHSLHLMEVNICDDTSDYNPSQCGAELQTQGRFLLVPLDSNLQRECLVWWLIMNTNTVACFPSLQKLCL